MKRIVICCDGTWNDAESKSAETNVARIARAIHATQQTGGILQVVLYLRGVGTSGLHAETLVEGATGLGIDDNIRSAYMFVAQNYVPGDEIFLFGFSRGAYTARSLAGFVSACGLLKRQRLADLYKAWDYYRKDIQHSPRDFMASCGSECHTGVEIKFLGVWDTVGALGIPGHLLSDLGQKKYAFHGTGPSPLVKHGCHALAIDERRDDFVPTFWTGIAPPGARIEQVWFAGAHADVGGGYFTRGLADIALVWMARKAEADGLALDWSCLPDPDALDPLAPLHDSRTLLFLKDRLLPTYREVMEKPCEVSFYERLYAPLNNDGTPATPIRQSLHRGVVERFGKPASVCVDDAKGETVVETYAPKNLTPCFDPSGRLLPDIPISD